MAVKAALDIGSNSIKLLVLEISGDGAYKILHDEYMVTGLGTGLVDGGNLQPEAVQKSLQCITNMVGTAQAFGASEVVAAGTAALRKAADSAEFVAKVAELAGVQIQVISAEEEARIASVVALRELSGISNRVVFFDIGGGSTELTWCEGTDAKRVVLMPLGARQLTEVAQVMHPVSQAMEGNLAAHISQEFSGHEIVPGGLLAGLGGTAVTLARLLKLDAGGGESGPHTTSVPAARIGDMLGQLRAMEIREVEALLDSDAARAPVIFAGAFLLNELLKRFGAEEFLLIDRGLRFGLLLGD